MIVPRTTPIAFSVGPVRSLPYMPALDGLRAIAVLAVVIYHANEAWLPGGYLGVEVFFTISGYLITALLITEFDRTDQIDFVHFWKRRAKRLLPALIGLLFGVALLALFTARDALGSLWGQGVASLAYVMNWSLILTEQSYFESFGRPPLLQHLWSLAIEEQFYLLMPPLFVVGRRLFGRAISLGIVVAGVVASTAFMWTRFDPTVDPSRLYYGTDTRAAGILVGVALAMVWRPWRPSGSRIERLSGTPFPDLLGLVGGGLLLNQFWSLGAYEPRLYHGGFLIISLLTAAVVIAVSMPGSLLAMPLGIKPLRWIGERSYGLYLWHWPVFMVLRPGVDTIVSEPWLTVLRFVAAFALAELSFTFVEKPVREGRFVQQVVELVRAAPEQKVLRRGVAILTVSALSVVGISTVQLNQGAAAASPVDVAATDIAALAAFPKDVEPTVVATPGDQTDDDEVLATAASSEEPGLADGPPAAYDRVLVFGDSVMVGAAEELEELDDAIVDAKIGRQWHELVEVEDLEIGPRDAVVIHLGNNGAATTDTIDAVLDSFSEAARVVLVTVRVPRPWESAVNRSLSGATGRWPNTVLADWRSESDGTPAYFAGDGVHLSGRGAAALASTIDYALRVPV